MKQGLVAVLALVVAGSVYLAAGSGFAIDEEAGFFFYIPAVLVAARYAGLGAGLTATAMALVWTLVFSPLLGPEGAPDYSWLWAWGLFGLVGALASVLCGQLHRARVELEREKERYRITLASIGDAVIATDRDRCIRLMNGEAQRLTGWTEREAIGQPLDAVVQLWEEDSGQPVENAAKTALQSDQVYSRATPVLLRSKSGAGYPVEESAAPILVSTFDRRADGVVLVLRDVSQQRASARLLADHARQLEERVRERTHFLQESLADMESFSYSVSHDLRAPLRAICSYTELLISDHRHQFDEEARVYLDRIHASAERLDQLTEDLLEYTRVSAVAITLQPVSLGNLVREAIADVARAEQPGVQIRVETPLPSVWGHETILRQILRNLVENGLKFVPPGRDPCLRIYATHRGRLVRLHVEDNGIGIAREDAARIFGMFERLEPLKYPGTGIGLAIVQRAVQKLQGTVGFESALGQGSTFWIELGDASRTGFGTRSGLDGHGQKMVRSR